jgi:hypothetical protein
MAEIPDITEKERWLQAQADHHAGERGDKDSKQP